jgi:Tfp pilus assembly protein PilN
MKLRRAPVLHLVIGEAKVCAEAKHADATVWAAEAEYQSTDELTEVIARLAAAPAERCRRLKVTVERPPAQTRTLKDLPPVRDRELTALVANQAGRFFRRNGAPLVTDAVWVANGKGRVTEAAAVEEPLLLAVLAGAAQAGLVVESITAAGLSPELQLLPSAERGVRGRARRRALLRLGVAVCGVWLLAATAFALRLTIERRQIDRELAAADAPLSALREVKNEMRAAEAMVVGMANARRSRGQALAALARINAAVPDSAVVTSYTWRADGTGIIAGSGRRAADVLAAIERRHAVPNARLDGAVVREGSAGRDWERFTIIFGGTNP